jgi:phosphoribosylanthranilate isomerase
MAALLKICGLTNAADAQLAVEVGADFLGFILYPKSPRYVTPEAIRQILAELSLGQRTSAPKTVGVFVNTPPDEIQRVLDATRLDLAQLHGDEPEEDLVALSGRGYKAIRPPDEAAAEGSLRFVPYAGTAAPQLLVDAYHPLLYGGSGQTGDWALAGALIPRVPRMMLAGGLTPDNVGSAVAAVHPWAVDVASGVETTPGRKDPAKVRDFAAALRASSPTS